MRQSVYLFVIASVAALALTQGPDWKYCSGFDGSKLSVSSTPVQPYPIKKGSPMKFTANGTAKVAINQKGGRMDVYTSGTKIFSTAVGAGASFSAGQAYSWSFTYTIPSFVPPGNYDIWISFIDTSGNPITCVFFNQNF